MKRSPWRELLKHHPGGFVGFSSLPANASGPSDVDFQKLGTAEQMGSLPTVSHSFTLV